MPKGNHKPGCKINMVCTVDHQGAPCPGPYGKCDCHMPKGTCCENCKGRAPLYGEYCTWSSCPCHQASEEKLPTVEEATKGLREAGYKVDHLAVSLASEEKVLPKEWSGFERLEKESALTFEEPAPLVGDWESQFDELFLQTMYQDDGYSEERAVLKDFIRSQIKISTLLGQEIGEEFGYNKGLLASEKESFKAGKAEVVRELREKVENIKLHILADEYIEKVKQKMNFDGIFDYGFEMHKKQVLALLDSLVDRTEI